MARLLSRNISVESTYRRPRPLSKPRVAWRTVHISLVLSLEHSSWCRVHILLDVMISMATDFIRRFFGHGMVKQFFIFISSIHLRKYLILFFIKYLYETPLNVIRWTQWLVDVVASQQEWGDAPTFQGISNVAGDIGQCRLKFLHSIEGRWGSCQEYVTMRKQSMT